MEGQAKDEGKKWSFNLAHSAALLLITAAVVILSLAGPLKRTPGPGDIYPPADGRVYLASLAQSQQDGEAESVLTGLEKIAMKNPVIHGAGAGIHLVI